MPRYRIQFVTDNPEMNYDLSGAAGILGVRQDQMHIHAREGLSLYEVATKKADTLAKLKAPVYWLVLGVEDIDAGMEPEDFAKLGKILVDALPKKSLVIWMDGRSRPSSRGHWLALEKSLQGRNVLILAEPIVKEPRFPRGLKGNHSALIRRHMVYIVSHMATDKALDVPFYKDSTFYIPLLAGAFAVGLSTIRS